MADVKFFVGFALKIGFFVFSSLILPIPKQQLSPGCLCFYDHIALRILILMQLECIRRFFGVVSFYFIVLLYYFF